MNGTLYTDHLCKQHGTVLEPDESCDHVMTFAANRAGSATIHFGVELVPLSGDGIARVAFMDVNQVVN